MSRPCAHPECHRNIALTADDYCVLHRPGVRFYTLPQSWKGIVRDDPEEVRTDGLFPVKITYPDIWTAAERLAQYSREAWGGAGKIEVIIRSKE